MAAITTCSKMVSFTVRLRLDDQIPIGVFGIAEEAVVVDLHFTLLVAIPQLIELWGLNMKREVSSRKNSRTPKEK